MIAGLVAFVGVVLVCLVVIEVFSDLFHPTRSGALSDALGRRTFQLLKRWRRSLPMAGPLAIVLTISAWVFLLVSGFALIYYAGFPESFRTSIDTIPREPSRLLASFYFSAQVVTTLAFGDIVAHSTAMRIAAVLEGLIGFGILTASVSSIVLIYPALSRLRLLARGVQHVRLAEHDAGVSIGRIGSDLIAANLARDVTNARVDLIHFPVVYFFAAPDPIGSLAYALPGAARIAAAAQAADAAPHVRLAGFALSRALDDLAALLAERFLSMSSENREAVFEAFAADHLLDRRMTHVD